MSQMLLDEIVINNKYLRINSNVDELVKSIEKLGLINPLIVNKKNELLAGGRRYSAAKKLGLEKVPVIVVNKNSLEEELISLDENLMRAALDDVEFESCLRRAKEVYEELNPNAKTFKEEREDLTADISEKEPSFCEYFAERTKISPNIIAKAIERDMHSSPKVKKMRAQKELNTSQANHLIKLSKKDQEEILPYVASAPKPKIKDIVKGVIEVGVEKTIEEIDNTPEIANDFYDLMNSCKRVKRIGARIIAEQLDLEGDEVSDILKQVTEAKKVLNEILSKYQE